MKDDFTEYYPLILFNDVPVIVFSNYSLTNTKLVFFIEDSENNKVFFFYLLFKWLLFLHSQAEIK